MNFAGRVGFGSPWVRSDTPLLAENLRTTLRGRCSAAANDIPASLRAELEDLLREPDSQLLAEGLLSLARRNAVSGHASFAALLYQSLAESSEEIPEAARREAHHQFEILQGRGNWGDRSEFFLRHFASQASDPALLLGMACGGVIYRTVRGLALGELAAASTLGSTALRFSAGATGFWVEAPAFVLATRGIRSVLGTNEPEGTPDLGREILSAYVFLGAMKLAGGATDLLQRRWVGEAAGLSPVRRFSTLLFPQVGMFGGILLGHRLERSLGLRPDQDSASLLAESLATLFHFHVSGRIFQELAGPRFQAWEGAMDRRTEALIRRPLVWRPLQPAPSLTELGSAMMMVGSGEGDSGVPKGEVAGAIRSSRSEAGPELGLRIQVDPEATVPQVLNRFSEILENESQPNSWVLELPPNFAGRVSDWGYSWQETLRTRYREDFSTLKRLHDGIERGDSLSEPEMSFLQELRARSLADLNAFVSERNLLSQLSERSRGSSVENGPSADRALKEVIHDLSYRPYFLQILDLAAGDLLEGNPLNPGYLDRIHFRGGFAVGRILQECVWRTSSESPEFAALLRKSFPVKDFLRLSLVQGGTAAQGLSDILANLLSNAWRYRRDGAGNAVLEPKLLADGSLQISVRDYGIGIEAENIAKLGSHGFREGRKDLANSHGFGLASVVTTLRRLDWGPLWVRSRVGEGTEFRFSIPREKLELGGAARSDHVPAVDLWGRGDPTEMERNLEAGFRVPVASLDLALHNVMREVPLSASSHEAHPEGLTHSTALQAGAFRHRRLEILHRLLTGNRELNGLKVVENGPGFTIDLSYTLLRSGALLTVKEPDPLSRRSHSRNVGKILDAESLSRFVLVSPEADTTGEFAHLVYWANPCEWDLNRVQTQSLGEYFGRDVAPGGFLVIQTDHHFDSQSGFLELSLANSRWERLFHEDLPDFRGASNHFLPTAQDHSLHLQIYRRLP